MTDIWQRRSELDKARRDFMKTAMAEFDKEHGAKLRALQEECTHPNERFTNAGPVRGLWYVCTHCQKVRYEAGDE